MKHNTRGNHDDFNLTPEEGLAKLLGIHDGDKEDDEDGESPHVIGVGPIEASSLVSFFKALGVDLPDMSDDEDTDNDTDNMQKAKGKAACDEDGEKDSTITLTFDGTGKGTGYTMGVHLRGSLEVAEHVMLEALCAMVEKNTPEIDVKALIEGLMINIALARSVAKFDADDDSHSGSNSKLN